jgi:hypothetical protein
MLLATVLILAATSALPDTPAVTLDEVIVTGTRLPESLASTPAAVSVVDRSDYADRRGLSLEDALGSVPGVFVQSRSAARTCARPSAGSGRGATASSNSGNIRGSASSPTASRSPGRTAPRSTSSTWAAPIASKSHARTSRRCTAAPRAGWSTCGRRSISGPLRRAARARRLLRLPPRAAVTGFTFGNGGRGTLSLLNSTFDGRRAHSASTSLGAHLRLTAPLDGRSRLGLVLDAASDLNRFPGPLTRAQADSAPRQANPRFAARDERRRNQIGRVGLSFERAIDPARDLALNFFLEPKVLQRSERDRFRDFNRTHAGGSATYQWRRAVRPGVESRLSLGGDGA